MLSCLAMVSDRFRPWDLARIAKVSDTSRLKISTSKQLLQRLPITLAQKSR